MKKFLILFMALTIVIATSVTSFANYEDDGVPLANIKTLIEQNKDEYPYCVLVFTGEHELYFFDSKPYYSNGELTFNGSTYLQYIYNTSGNYELVYTGSNGLSFDEDVKYTSVDLYEGNTLIVAHDPYYLETLTMSDKVNNVVGDTMSNNFFPKFKENVGTLLLVGVGILSIFIVLSFLKKKNIMHI